MLHCNSLLMLLTLLQTVTDCYTSVTLSYGSTGVASRVVHDLNGTRNSSIVLNGSKISKGYFFLDELWRTRDFFLFFRDFLDGSLNMALARALLWRNNAAPGKLHHALEILSYCFFLMKMIQEFPTCFIFLSNASFAGADFFGLNVASRTTTCPPYAQELLPRNTR